MKKPSVVLVLPIWALLTWSMTAGTALQPASRPQLLVMLVIDQMRFEYLDRFASSYSAGLRRLLTEGAVFERTFYPYSSTITCAGHATIGTGAFPSTHGVILNEWWQRDVNRRMQCTEDPRVTSAPYAGPTERIGHSAHRLRVETLGDRLRGSSPRSRVLSLSMKPRSAVMMAGHGGAVAWLGDPNEWATSSAFEYVPEIKAYVEANPIEADRGAVWERALDVSQYIGVDNGVGERGPRGWTPTFPHPLAGTAPTQFNNLWERSPFSDAYLGRMAASLATALQLGRRGVVDLLAVSFAALDYVGHDFGPDSHEVQDTLVRLDRTLGAFFDSLDKHVGRDGYVVGVSADHGVAEIPEARQARGLDAGRVLREDVHKVAESAMTAAFGAGPFIAHVEYTDLYLTPRGLALVRKTPAAWRTLIDAVARMPGVERVLIGEELEKKRQSADPGERAAALSYFRGHSGDAIILFKPHWIGTNTSAATHGTRQPYDQHVPLIFMGLPFKPGRYADAATPADLAPTLGSIVRLTLPRADGKVQKAAVK